MGRVRLRNLVVGVLHGSPSIQILQLQKLYGQILGLRYKILVAAANKGVDPDSGRNKSPEMAEAGFHGFILRSVFS